MEIALAASILSSFCLAIMVVTDRLMVGDCYDGNSDHAWFVSSVAGSVFGLFLTLLVSLCMIFLDILNPSELVSEVVQIFWWQGLAMIGMGAVAIQLLLHYFRCFAEEANSTSIASWLAATPIFVYTGMLIISSLSGNTAAYLQPLWLMGVILATAGLVAFERITSGKWNGVGAYKQDLTLMILCNVIYIVGINEIFERSESSDSLASTLALMIFYWIGFSAGVRILASHDKRASFIHSWKLKIRHYAIPILFVEIVGMLVFWFEYLGLTELNPTYVSIIVGANVFLVYIMDVGLGIFRKKLERDGIEKIIIFRIPIVADKLPTLQGGLIKTALEFLAVIVTAMGIFLATLHMNL